MKTIIANHDTYALIGISIFLFGVIIRLLITKRQFYRSKSANHLIYTTYWHYLPSAFPESLVNFAAYGLLYAGIIMVIQSWYN